MKKFFLFLVILLSSCVSQINDNISKNDFDYSNDISFKEFELKLENYAKNNPYPNLND